MSTDILGQLGSEYYRSYMQDDTDYVASLWSDLLRGPIRQNFINENDTRDRPTIRLHPESSGPREITNHSETVAIGAGGATSRPWIIDGVFSSSGQEFAVSDGVITGITSRGNYIRPPGEPRWADDVDEVGEDNDDLTDSMEDLREDLSLRISEVEDDLRSKIEDLEDLIDKKSSQMNDMSRILQELRMRVTDLSDRLERNSRQDDRRINPDIMARYYDRTLYDEPVPLRTWLNDSVISRVGENVVRTSGV